MIVVGEKINSSRKSIARAIEERDRETIVAAARAQAEAGAAFIDVNAGTFVGQEVECLCWLVECVQAEVDLPLCLDSPDPNALAAAIRIHQGEPMLNSISLEEERYRKMLPVVTAQPCHVVALCMSAASMPSSVEERVAAGTELVKRLTFEGVPGEKIYVDPLVQPVSVDVRMGTAVLGAIREIMKNFPDVHTICGLSNISFGLPARKLINRTFLAQAIACGLDATILDPTDTRLMATLLAAETLAGQDKHCMHLIKAHHAGRLAS
jgi:5-methyltetrahydrofolate--homocysteine methyltransferase